MRLRSADCGRSIPDLALVRAGPGVDGALASNGSSRDGRDVAGRASFPTMRLAKFSGQAGSTSVTVGHIGTKSPARSFERPGSDSGTRYFDALTGPTFRHRSEDASVQCRYRILPATRSTGQQRAVAGNAPVFKVPSLMDYRRARASGVQRGGPATRSGLASSWMATCPGARGCVKNERGAWNRSASTNSYSRCTLAHLEGYTRFVMADAGNGPEASSVRTVGPALIEAKAAAKTTRTWGMPPDFKLRVGVSKSTSGKNEAGHAE